MSPLRVVGWAAGAVAIAGGVYLLREATMTTSYATDPGSRLEVVVESRNLHPGAFTDAAELTRAHLSYCRTLVAADLVGGLRPVPADGDRFSVTFQPALDSSDRKQLEGCIEDWVLDRHLLEVISMRELVSQ